MNLGTYRVMIHDEKSVGSYISPGKHGRVRRDKCFARNKPMPVAVVAGNDTVEVIAVDDEIDVSNIEEVLWAMVTRSDPATSIGIIHNAWSTSLDPRIHPEDKAKGKLTNSRAIIDATRLYEWRHEFPKVNIPSPETARKAREKFSYLLDGFTKRT